MFGKNKADAKTPEKTAVTSQTPDDKDKISQPDEAEEVIEKKDDRDDKKEQKDEKEVAAEEQETGAKPHPEINAILDKTKELADTVDSSTDSINNLFSEMVTNITDEDFKASCKEDSQLLSDSMDSMRDTYKKVFMINDELDARAKDLEHSLEPKRKHHLFKPAPANAIIDAVEESGKHFAEGTNFYKLVLIFAFGSFAGLLLETCWRILLDGDWGSRAGLIYGPFSPLYGVGALGLSIALYRYRNMGRWISFVGGFIVGTAAEYVCSVMLQYCFHIVSWDYSRMPFNLNGRICLLYSIFWGILGILWIKEVYPRFSAAVLKIPNFIGRIFTILLTLFLAFDIAATICTVYRWSQRDYGIPASNEFWEFIDEHYPDERMHRVFSNMNFMKSDGTTDAEYDNSLSQDNRGDIDTASESANDTADTGTSGGAVTVTDLSGASVNENTGGGTVSENSGTE